MQVASSVLDLIGRTPMVEASRLDTGPCKLYIKLEALNPGGSIKDRIGLSMIDAAEKRGAIKPGDLLVEATAGNTGLGLALVAAIRGYRLLIVMPDKMSREKVFNVQAMGAEVMMTRSDVQKGHPEYYQDMAQRLAGERGGYYINQFGNEDNAAAHEKTTGPEILEQLDGKVDAVVLGVGTSGTFTGVSRYFRKHSPDTEFVLADPEGSVLAEYIKTGKLGEARRWMVEGIGEDYIPTIADLSAAKRAYTIPDAESFAVAREVLRKEGLLLGSSSGTLIAAALRYCREQTEPKNVVTLGCDTGAKYLSKVYNDFWLAEHGFVATEPTGTLADLVTRPQDKNATVTVLPEDTLAIAHDRLRDGGYSQLPVVHRNHLVGGITEGDLLRAAIDSDLPLDAPVERVMNTGFPRMDVTASYDLLAERLSIEPAVAIEDGDEFLGIVTRADYLTWIRNKGAKA
ncbi:MAG: pyridoxal-phosphate dependent enzyme [Gammaproteobacteria bacterium]|nr:pyridoxal-phosphate dependent enzyme [Gammaproteobacteria bacterium]